MGHKMMSKTQYFTYNAVGRMSLAYTINNHKARWKEIKSIRITLSIVKILRKIIYALSNLLFLMITAKPSPNSMPWKFL